MLLLGMLPISQVGDDAWFGPMCFALAPFTIMMALKEHTRRINLAHLRVTELLAIDVPIAILQSVLLFGLAYYGRLSAMSALFVIALSCAGAIVWLARRRHLFRFAPQRVGPHWGHNLRFGRWLLGVSLLWLLADSSYRWLVVLIQGTESLGQFAAAQNIVLLLNPLLLTVTNLTLAMSANRLATGGVAALQQMTVRNTLLLAAGSGIGLLALTLVGGPLVEIVFGHSYAGLGPVVATLCLGMFARIVAMPIDGAIVALQRGRLLVAASTLRLVSIVGAGVPLIAWRGLEGVGYAMAASAAAGAVLQWWGLLQENGDVRR
jgi:O-antigen/teichoic acid export membrane protein